MSFPRGQTLTALPNKQSLNCLVLDSSTVQPMSKLMDSHSIKVGCTVTIHMSECSAVLLKLVFCSMAEVTAHNVLDSTSKIYIKKQ